MSLENQSMNHNASPKSKMWLPTESVWDFDQRFKTLVAKVSFQMSNVQHKEWFITALLPHMRTPLLQQKIMSQIEALEIEMKLEASPIGDTG